MKLDNKGTIALHGKLIKNKKLLNTFYLAAYKQFEQTSFPEGKVIELGSGGGFIKKIMPKVVTSDVVSGVGIDKVFGAEEMPFQSKGVSGLVMLNTFHHIKDPGKAMGEFERCLKPGGKIVMVEPWNSFWGRFIYKTFHHEDFDPTASWKIKGKGRLSGANGALPWIVFDRDRDKFEKKYKKLKINHVIPHSPLIYLLTGGLSKWKLVPDFTIGGVMLIEKLLSPFNKYLGMFVSIEIEKI